MSDKKVPPGFRLAWSISDLRPEPKTEPPRPIEAKQNKRS